MTREEVHRRYLPRPDIHKAEPIGGVVYMPSPARRARHGRHQSLAILWLGTYTADKPELGVGDNDTVYLTGGHEVQPDAFLVRISGSGAGAQLGDDGCIEGTPELVVEIAASSVSHELHDKKEAYRRAGVLEYIAWRVLDEHIDWLSLQNGEYVRLEPDAGGLIESRVFAGLRMSLVAMLASDRAAVLAGVRS